jgi:hypothetical protein
MKYSFFSCILKVTLLIFLFFSLSGCTTYLVKNTFDQQESSVSTALINAHGKQIEGKYHGVFYHPDLKKCWHFTIKGILDSCNQEKTLELSIPLENNATLNTKPIRICRTPSLMISSSQPIQVISSQKEMSIANIKPLLLSETWKGYPTTLIIGQSQNENDQVIVAYRAGSSDNDILINKSDISNLKFACKRKETNPAFYFLMPITVAVDIVTSPIQLILFGPWYEWANKSHEHVDEKQCNYPR